MHSLSHPYSVGLTGGIGSGKTVVANMFKACGAAMIDTDIISRHLTAPDGKAIPLIKKAFGSSMIEANGAMNRAKMRELIFTTVSQKKKLEAILHPLIQTEVIKQMSMCQEPYIICVVPLLIETKTWAFQRILVVDCSEETQIKRVMTRDHLTRSFIQKILDQQATRAERLKSADDVIMNETSIDHIALDVHKLHDLYCQLASEP